MVRYLDVIYLMLDVSRDDKVLPYKICNVIYRDEQRDVDKS